MGNIGAVDPWENEREGDSGWGVDSWLPVLRDESVDIRRNQEDPAVPVPLYSEGREPGLDDRFESRLERSVHSESSFIRRLGAKMEGKSPPLSLFADESGLPRELRFRSRDVVADVGNGDGEGVEGVIEAD